MKRKWKFLSFMLSLLLLTSSFGELLAYANDQQYDEFPSSTFQSNSLNLEVEQKNSISVLEARDLPWFIDVETAREFGHTKRLVDEETSLDSVLYENMDGTRTLYVFDYAVKYIDLSGNICDKSQSMLNNIETRIANDSDNRNNILSKDENEIGVTLKFDFSNNNYISFADQINYAYIVLNNEKATACYALKNSFSTEGATKVDLPVNASFATSKINGSEKSEYLFDVTNTINEHFLYSPLGEITFAFSAKTDQATLAITGKNDYTETYQTNSVLVINYDTMLLTSGDRYYFNNDETGKYLNKAASSITGISGYVSNIGASIEWKVTYVSNGRYTIQSVQNDSLYLAVPSDTSSSSVTIETMPSSHLRYQWEVISGGQGYGGVRLINAYNNRALHSDGTSISTQLDDSNDYGNKVWKAFDIDFYGASYMPSRELQSFTAGNLFLNMGEIGIPSITKSPNNALWSTAKDYSFSVSEHYESKQGCILPMIAGTVSVTAIHKVTGATNTFSLQIEDYICTKEVLIGSSINVKNTVGHYAGILQGASWSVSNPSVATIDSNGLVTGLMSDYCFVYAKDEMGTTLLSCQIKVMDERTQKLQAFTTNEIEYLYSPSSYLRSWMAGMDNDEAFSVRVDIIHALRPLYVGIPNPQPSAAEIKTALLHANVKQISDEVAQAMFVECRMGYNGLYNVEYLTAARIEYFNYLKQIVIFCAYSMAGQLDPVNTLSDCQGLDDLCYDLSKAWGNNENSSYVMLGPNGYKGVYYSDIAEMGGYRYFYSTDYDYYCNLYGSDFVRSVNTRFLQRCLEEGCVFYFCYDPTTAPLTSSLHMEYQYLKEYYTALWGNAYLVLNSLGYLVFSPTP